MCVFALYSVKFIYRLVEAGLKAMASTIFAYTCYRKKYGQQECKCKVKKICVELDFFGNDSKVEFSHLFFIYFDSSTCNKRLHQGYLLL